MTDDRRIRIRIQGIVGRERTAEHDLQTEKREQLRGNPHVLNEQRAVGILVKHAGVAKPVESPCLDARELALEPFSIAIGHRGPAARIVCPYRSRAGQMPGTAAAGAVPS